MDVAWETLIAPPNCVGPLKPAIFAGAASLLYPFEAVTAISKEALYEPFPIS
jgi:hypothetical protein